VDPGRGDGVVADRGGSQVPDGYGCLVWSSTRSTAPAPRRPGALANTQGGGGGVDAGLRVGAGRSLPGWRHAIGPRFVSLVANRENSKATQSAGVRAGGGRDVPATTQAASQRSAQAVEATAMVAPPAGAPPGPVLAEVTKLPQDNDSGDEKAEPKPGTGTQTATAEPPTNRWRSGTWTGTSRRRWDGTRGRGSGRRYRATTSGDAARHRLGLTRRRCGRRCHWSMPLGESEERGRCPARTRLSGSRRTAVIRCCGMARGSGAAGRRAFGSPPAPTLSGGPHRRGVRWARHAAPAWPCPPAGGLVGAWQPGQGR
jgi:hypothetical protein